MQFIHELSLFSSTYMYGLLCSTSWYLWFDRSNNNAKHVVPVIECTGIPENEAGRRIFRARFSSVTEKDILTAMDNLVLPNKDEALSVDARQEIDLKVGVAFTRFQTRYFQGKYGNLDSRVIS